MTPPDRMASFAPVSPADKPMVLVVDDQVSNIQALYEILKSDYEVCMAIGGAEAIAFCQERQPDLILLDVMMPGIGGYEVCHWLKANEPTQSIPVIFATAQNDPAEEAQGLDEGAVDFISKPFHARVVLARVRTHLTLRTQSEQLRILATIDGLTGIANRRQFDAVLAREWRQCARSDMPLAVILLDIDFFKRYNDHCGHQAGDACIQAVASVLQSRFHRPHDLVARYGGEEFVCLLPGTPLSGASQKAVELEQAVRELGISHATSDVAPVVTISLGVAVAASVKDSDPAKLIAAADRLLYGAKQAGRGQAHCGELSS